MEDGKHYLSNSDFFKGIQNNDLRDISHETNIVRRDFNLKTLNFDMNLTSYRTCLESLKKITIW